MTDLRGVLPSQRPPVDAAVLDEPTSEVPVIRPAGGRADPEADSGPDSGTDSGTGETDSGTGPEAAAPVGDPVDDPRGDPDWDLEPGADQAEAALEPPAAWDPGAAELADPDDAPDPAGPEWTDPATVAARLAAADPPAGDAPAGPDLTGGDLTGPDLTGWDAALAPDLAPSTRFDPEVTDMTEPAFPSRTTEMSKMTWQPAGSRFGSRPEPASPLAEAAPGPEPDPLAPLAASGSLPDLAPVTSLPDLAPAADLGVSTRPDPLAAVEPGGPAGPVEPLAPAGPAATTGFGAAPAEAAGLGTAPARDGRPGDVAENAIALWSEPAVAQLRDRWRELQGQFIDDPDAAVAGAKSLVTEAVRTLADTLLTAQDELDPYRGDGRADTETMRVAMRRYREFLERVLAL